jgi:mannosyltransferase OCH1-like enzyme
MIPKVIYMCHKNLDKIKIYSQNWAIKNPDYDIKLYDDEMCKKFLIEEYSQLHLDIFNFIQDGPIKADFWRVCIINKYGGLYVDADIEPIVPLKEYIEDDDDFVTCIARYFDKKYQDWNLNPHFILSNKNNNILQKCIDSYIELYTNKIQYNYWDWSICKIMNIDEIIEKKSQILYSVNNKKYKFLFEQSENVCEYNNKVVLHNRYKNYINHNFV